MNQAQNFKHRKLIRPFIAAQDITPNSRLYLLKCIDTICRWYKDNQIEQPRRETILSYKFWLDTKQLSSFTKAMYIVVIAIFFCGQKSQIFIPILHG